MSFRVQCPCGKRRGLIATGTLLCPGCDYGDGDAGPWVEDRVKDVDPTISEITTVRLTVGDSMVTVGWVADLHGLPGLLESVAQELRDMNAERVRDLS